MVIANVMQHGGWGYGPPFPFFLFPVFWALALGGLVFLASRRRRAWSAWASPTRSAEAVLAESFARGELDEEQYRRRLEVLRQGR